MQSIQAAPSPSRPTQGPNIEAAARRWRRCLGSASGREWRIGVAAVLQECRCRYSVQTNQPTLSIQAMPAEQAQLSADGAEREPWAATLTSWRSDAQTACAFSAALRRNSAAPACGWTRLVGWSEWRRRLRTSAGHQRREAQDKAQAIADQCIRRIKVLPFSSCQ